MLIFDNWKKTPILADQYIKSQVGKIVTAPIRSHFEMMVDDTLLLNSPLGAYPSAYASFLNANNHPKLDIYVQSGRYRLTIILNHFEGVGTYRLGTDTTGYAEYYIWGGDVGLPLGQTHEEAGTITFTAFDLTEGRCSGEFDFVLSNREETFPASGNFEIPVFD